MHLGEKVNALIKTLGNASNTGTVIFSKIVFVENVSAYFLKELTIYQNKSTDTTIGSDIGNI